MQKNKFNIGDKVKVVRSARELYDKIGYIAGGYTPVLELNICKSFTVKSIILFDNRIGYCEDLFGTPIFDEDLLELYDEEKEKKQADTDLAVERRAKEMLRTLIKEMFEGYGEKKDQK